VDENNVLRKSTRYGRGATAGDGGVAGAPASFQLITELKIMLNSRDSASDKSDCSRT
jgi:hypothetical protein